jgi:hypothetical protein
VLRWLRLPVTVSTFLAGAFAQQSAKTSIVTGGTGEAAKKTKKMKRKGGSLSPSELLQLVLHFVLDTIRFLESR